MVGCVLGQLKSSEIYILNCGLFHSKECRAPRALSYGDTGAPWTPIFHIVLASNIFVAHQPIIDS